jgi:hypothetical protein
VTFSTRCDGAAAALFSAAPSVDAAGVLTFTPAANAFGSSQCTVTLAEAGEGGLSATAGLSIEVTPLNDPPSFSAGDDTISVLGDSAPYSAAWASDISAGPGEQGQEVDLSIACSAAAGSLFSAGPAISAAGVLSFTPAKTKSGSTNCTVTLAEASQGGLKATAPLTIVVADGEQTLWFQFRGNKSRSVSRASCIMNSSCMQCFLPCIYSCSMGNSCWQLPVLRQQCCPSLFAACSSTTACAAASAATLTVAVNYAPSFVAGPSPITVAEGSAPYSAAWATNVSAGPGDDEDVSLAIECDAAADSLFAAGPAISSDGVLSFTPAAHKSGSSRCSVTLAEAGVGGLSANASLVIQVTAGATNEMLALHSNCFSQQQQQQQQQQLQQQQQQQQCHDHNAIFKLPTTHKRNQHDRERVSVLHCVPAACAMHLIHACHP